MKTIRTATLALGLIATVAVSNSLEAQFRENPIWNPQYNFFYTYNLFNTNLSSVVNVNDANPQNILVTVAPTTGGQFVVEISGVPPLLGSPYMGASVAPMTAELMGRMSKEFMSRRAVFNPLELTQFRNYVYTGKVIVDHSSRVKLTVTNPSQPSTDIGRGGGIVDVLITNSNTYFAEVSVRRFMGEMLKCKLLRAPINLGGASLQPLPDSRVRDFFDVAFNGVPFIKVHQTERDSTDGSQVLHAGSWWVR